MTTTTEEPVTLPTKVDVETDASIFIAAMGRLEGATGQQLDQAGIPAPLREIVRLRASQINGCAYCVDMHARDARTAGESEAKVFAVAVWRESPFFTARERAALAFTEAVTKLAGGPIPEEVYDEMEAVFSAEEIGALLSLIVMINAWNALAVTSRAWRPEISAGEAGA
jgi:AhpD family alkylhydroperoxidase